MITTLNKLSLFCLNWLKILAKRPAILLLGCIIANLCLASPVKAKNIIILPFNVNVSSDLATLNRDLPVQLGTILRKQGHTIIPAPEELRQNASNLEQEKILELAKQASADAVVIGNFNQLGDGFSLDSKIVDVAKAETKDFQFERPSLLAIAEGLENLANEVAPSSQMPVASQEATRQEARQAANWPTLQTDQSALVPMSGSNRISDIQIRGLRGLDPDVVLLRLSLRKGDQISTEAINEEVKRIWEMGYFNDVQVAIEGQTLIFNVSEKPRIDNIIVEGQKAIDADDILAAMGSKSGNVLNEQILAEDLQKIEELYRKDGYYLAKANYRLDSRNDGRSAVLVINMSEGHKLYIKEVKIEGLQQIKRGDLDSYLALKSRNILSWFNGSGVLKDEYIERDTNAISAFGLSQGFVDIQVSHPAIEYREDGIYITFIVNEGQRYKVNKINFVGDIIETEAEMLKVITLDDYSEKEGHFSVTVLQEDSTKLTDYYADQGYAFANVDTRVQKVEGSETPMVDVNYIVEKKQKVFIRRLVVDGNIKTRDNVIMREMRLADGDPYEGQKMRRSSERLNRLRYFTAVDHELIPTGKDEEVDLKIRVKEDNTGAIMGGIGYSTYYSVGVTASIMERNLFGRGYWLQLSGFFSWRRSSGTLSFTNPRIFDTDFAVSNELYYLYDYWDSFTKETMGDTIRLSHPIGEYSSIGLGYRLERYYISDVNDNTTPYISDYTGTNWTSALSVSLGRDTTDTRDRPTKGTITRLWAEYGGGGLGGTDNFFKIVGDWQGFLTPIPQHTLHLRLRLGGAFQNYSKRVPVFERFWVGGMDTIRGYSYTDLSPRDKKYTYDNQIGGDRMGVMNLEYIWTFEKDLGLALVPFLDAGFNIDSKTMGHDFERNFGDRYIVASTGLELRWRSPMGDLRIAYGIPLVRDYDREMESGRIEFSMGQFF